MKQNLFDENKSEMDVELDCLKDENIEMREFFDKLAIPIVKKALRNVEKQLRDYPTEAKLFGDDSKLILFEEFCVMQQECSNGYVVEIIDDTIFSCCHDAYNELTDKEKFIINHQTISIEKTGVEIFVEEFLKYISNYENKRIKESIQRRLLTDDY